MSWLRSREYISLLAPSFDLCLEPSAVGPPLSLVLSHTMRRATAFVACLISVVVSVFLLLRACWEYVGRFVWQGCLYCSSSASYSVSLGGSRQAVVPRRLSSRAKVLSEIESHIVRYLFLCTMSQSLRSRMSRPSSSLVAALGVDSRHVICFYIGKHGR